MDHNRCSSHDSHGAAFVRRAQQHDVRNTKRHEWPAVLRTPGNTLIPWHGDYVRHRRSYR